MSALPDAPGAPGIPPTWASSAKDAVGTSLGTSRVWFTLGYGIVNEVFYPHVDMPQIRDLGFIVADGNGFWAEVKRVQRYGLSSPAPGIPAYEIRHEHERYHLTLRVCTDPNRDVLLIESSLVGEAVRLYVLLAPHLGDSGHDNRAWIEVNPLMKTLFASRNGHALALVAVDDEANDGILRASCGYVGASDGWQDFHRNGRMSWAYPAAGPGNVALMAEIPARVRLCLGFDREPAGAQTLARSSTAESFEHAWQVHIRNWTAWHETMHRGCSWWGAIDPAIQNEAQVSSMVLKCHEDKVFRGATVASLSTPWGQSHDDSGGYHLVWTRDLVEAAMALLAIGAGDDARSILYYLIATQKGDGHWHQNQWLDGRSYWQGIQLDETAFPILLASALATAGSVEGCVIDGMVQRAATYLARHGPVTEQDRWEEDSGIDPFTLAVCIAALVCAAPFLSETGRTYALELADIWNAGIERWTFVSDNELAETSNVRGYYVRIAPAEALTSPIALRGYVPLKNQPADRNSAPASQVLSLGFLQLVRMGLRKPEDQRIRDSVCVADALLKVETPSGPVWHRYVGDGYGEHADGRPFDGTGVGRGWPLLTGERGQYACAAGQDVMPYLRAMLRMTSTYGMIPEQVWDAAPIPDRALYPGRPTLSASPLVWAHAEFIKLCASKSLGHAFDRPDAVWRRYAGNVPDPLWCNWRLNHKRTSIPTGKILRIELLEPARVHYSFDGWKTVLDADTRDAGLGVHVVDLSTRDIESEHVVFTFFWLQRGAWEGRDFDVLLQSSSSMMSSAREPQKFSERRSARVQGGETAGDGSKHCSSAH